MSFPRSALARCAVLAVLGIFAAAFPQIAMAQSNPLVGTWKLLPEKSTGTPRYQSMTLTFSDPTVMNVEGVDAQGKPVKGSFTAVTDGKPHPITGIPGFDAGTWSRYNDANTTYSYLRGKSIVALGTRTISPDGKTLTFNEKLYDTNGKQTGTSMMVFDNPNVKVATVVPKPAAAPAPRGPTADEAAGEAAWQKGDADATIAAFTRALDKKEPGANPHYDYVMRGVAYAKKEQYEQASADFDQALMLKPDDVDARFRRGGTRFQLRQYPGVIEDMTEVVKADPMNATAYYMRGRSYYMVDQNMNSAEDTAKACSLNKQFCMP